MSALPDTRFSTPAIAQKAATPLLAQATYEELVAAGLTEADIMAFAGELLSLVASGVRQRPEAT